MATAVKSKTKKAAPRRVTASTVGKVASSVAKKAKGKKNIAGIVSAIAAPVALLAIGYGLTRLDARTGGKVMSMVLDKFHA